jgi:hypothetical protein
MVLFTADGLSAKFANEKESKVKDKKAEPQIKIKKEG